VNRECEIVAIISHLRISRFTFHVSRVTLVALLSASSTIASQDLTVLKPGSFAHYIEQFNSMEEENVTNFIANAKSSEWLRKNIPFFECPDRKVEEIYYFRWWSFRKHIKQTPAGFVITEFLTPVKHAGIYNTISCALGHHLAEGRWLRDQQVLDDYTHFWFRGNNGVPQPHLHKYSNWAAAAIFERLLVNGDTAFTTNLVNDLVADYRAWGRERRRSDGLFWQYDARDGMEESISGSRTNKNARPTINSYMFGNAQAIGAIARLAGRTDLADEFEAEAAALKRLVQEKLWNADAQFFEVRLEDGTISNAREELGFIPWYFHLPVPGKGYEAAWSQLTDANGFRAPYGITTAERRHPEFRSHGCYTCEWDGAVWPFATSQTLVALANLLRDYASALRASLSPIGGEGQGEGAARPLPVSSRDYFDAFLTYVHSQHANGKPYIGEYLDEVTGDWINGKGGRSRYYNHSTFADLLITGVVGLRPRPDETVEVSPLLPEDTWDWFCLDGVKYHGRTLTIFWDKDGKRYGRGAGLRVLANGNEIAKTEKLERVTGKLAR
jgi:hypothetical protein